MDTYFPASIVPYVDRFRQSFPAQHFAYFRGYVWALAMLGTTRKCMTNIARTCVFVDRHLASWERCLAVYQWELRTVHQRLVTQLLQDLGASMSLWEALLAAVDTTLVAKVRGKMPGVQQWPDPRGNPARGESWVGHHGALIGLGSTWGTSYLCGPVLARLLPGQRNPLGCVAGAEGIQRLDVWLVVVALVRELQQDIGDRPLRVVADASCSKAAFLHPLIAQGVTVIRRRRKDAVGWDDPAPIVGKRPRGRPRKPGRAWKVAPRLDSEPAVPLTVTIYGKVATVCVACRDVWRRDIPAKMRVVAIATTGGPILLVRTDVTLPPAVLIPLYAARFPLELALRDRKQYGGLGDYHCWTLWAIHRFVHLALTAVWLWRLTRLRDQQASWLRLEGTRLASALTPLSFPRLHRALRCFVLQRMCAASACSADWEKTAPTYAQLFRIAA